MAGLVGHPIQLLVADDSETLRAIVRITAESQDWIVLEASSAAETIDLIRSQRPDLLLLDLDFGAGPRGLTVLHELRSSPDLAGIPVIVLTGSPDADEQARANGMGAMVMLKPFSPIDLISTIRVLLGVDVEPGRLGLRLMHDGAVTARQLERALDHQAAREESGETVRIGQVLIDQGAISEDELATALRAQPESLTPRRPRVGRPSRVLVIDDSHAVRDGLRALLGSDTSLHIVGEASSAMDGLKLARALRPDLIVLDNEMSETRGIEILPALRSEAPRSRIVMFTMTASIASEARALGASAVVAKDDGETSLLETLRSVRRGDDRDRLR